MTALPPFSVMTFPRKQNFVKSHENLKKMESHRLNKLFASFFLKRRCAYTSLPESPRLRAHKGTTTVVIATENK